MTASAEGVDRWARWVRDNDARSVPWLHGVRDRILDAAAVVEGSAVLDLGAGNGLVGLGAAERRAEVPPEGRQKVLRRPGERSDAAEWGDRLVYLPSPIDERTCHLLIRRRNPRSRLNKGADREAAGHNAHSEARISRQAVDRIGNHDCRERGNLEQIAHIEDLGANERPESSETQPFASRAHSLPAGPRRARWIDATITSPRKLSRVATSAGANETLPAW
jgi:hypothetical protein